MRAVDADVMTRSGNVPQLILPEGIELSTDTQIIPPKPAEHLKVVHVDAHPAIDMVRFRFNVDATGTVSNVRVVHTTKDQIVNNAKSALEAWQFEPALVDGKPAELKDYEVVMDFVESENEAGSTIAKGALLVLLLPVMVFVDIGSTGSLDFGN